MSNAYFTNQNLFWQARNTSLKFRRYGYNPTYTFGKPDLTSWYNAIDHEQTGAESHRTMKVITRSFFDLAYELDPNINRYARDSTLVRYANDVMSDTEGGRLHTLNKKEKTRCTP